MIVHDIINEITMTKLDYHINYINALLTFLINEYSQNNLSGSNNSNSINKINFDSINDGGATDTVTSDENKYKRFYIFLHYLVEFMKKLNIKKNNMNATNTFEQFKEKIENVKNIIYDNYKYFESSGNIKPMNDTIFIINDKNKAKITKYYKSIQAIVQCLVVVMEKINTIDTNLGYKNDIIDIPLQSELNKINALNDTRLIDIYQSGLLKLTEAEQKYKDFLATNVRKTPIEINPNAKRMFGLTQTKEFVPENPLGRASGFIRNRGRVGLKYSKYGSTTLAESNTIYIPTNNSKNLLNKKVKALKSVKNSLTQEKLRTNLSTVGLLNLSGNITTNSAIPTKTNKKLSNLQNYAQTLINTGAATPDDSRILIDKINEALHLYNEIKEKAKAALKDLKANVQNKVTKAKRVHNIYKHAVPAPITELITAGEAFSTALDGVLKTSNQNSLPNMINKIADLNRTSYNAKVNDVKYQYANIDAALLNHLKKRAKTALADLVEKLVDKVSNYTHHPVKNITKARVTVGTVKPDYYYIEAVSDYVNEVAEIVTRLKGYYDTNVNAINNMTKKININKNIYNLYNPNHTNLNNGTSNQHPKSKEIKRLYNVIIPPIPPIPHSEFT